MLKKIYIEHVGTDQFAKRFREVTLPYEGNFTPVRSLFDSLQEPPLSCKTVIFEADYVDEDYRDEYSSFYSKAFKDYPPRCVRMHFFSTKIATHARELGRFRKHYLGFMVLRPTDIHRMGRTVVCPIITNPHQEFIHCHAVFKTHILGEEFAVEGMPFIQQDTQVGACAQASLWMVARYMSARFNLRQYFPAQINGMAKSTITLGRQLPAERGLIEWQMLDALEGMGFSAVSYSRDDIAHCSQHIDVVFSDAKQKGKNRNRVQARRLRDLCTTSKLADIAYRYIESGLPVVFSTRNHALVGIGHTYNPATHAKTTIQRIPAFIVHNDSVGPYGTIPIFGAQKRATDLTFSQVESIIAVIPPEVTLSGEEAESMARWRFENLLSEPVDPSHGMPMDVIIKRLRPDLKKALGVFEYRTYLMPSTEFQRDLRIAVKAKRFHRSLGLKLVQLDYPKYIWITEISSRALLNRPSKADRQCFARIIIDSTAPAKTKGELVIHCFDFVCLQDRNSRQAKNQSTWTHYKNSVPFVHRSPS